ncbi:hypothetical protein A3C86_04285 [Candidatus Kaiserbacteria bacterium RIFCSPHIGHO2_02_FULL_49_16]|uniref:Phosphate transport regulator n=2 Tax=Candidatus Kaiseribacteriota TaxID=1752734 RepID=A0A1F6DDM1_9BACT|nr:MAG: hypothetical protein A3C86_04285 [Candidatus Kaiserbacteria bacterium RIFCSPHIGHO2_02_FULL_49_16]
MSLVSATMEKLLGGSQNGRLAVLLARQAAIADECAGRLYETECRALEEIVAFERDGDAVEARIHEIIDSSFILRFDKADIANLANMLDNVVDGMRRVATHVDTYNVYIPKSQTEVKEFLTLIKTMTAVVQELAALLEKRRLPLNTIKNLNRKLFNAETDADAILHKAGKALVKIYGEGKGNAIEFIARDKLLRLLEGVTDSANRCGTCILSLARKEA